MIPTPIELINKVHPTPIVKLRNRINDSALYAKLEFFNPFSQSIKDRPAKRILEEAISSSLPKKIYEASSGNFAIALTLLSNAYGIPVRIYLPKGSPTSTQSLLKLLGAEVVITDFDSINPEMIEMVKEEAERDGAVNLNQFENDLNPQTHYEETGKELVEQLLEEGVKPTHLIVGLGTTGTLWGVVRRVEEVREWRGIKIIGVQPAKGSKIPGIKRIESRPKWIGMVELNEILDVSDREAALGAIEVGRKEGLPIGLSSGAVYIAYKKIAERERGVFVTIFPDSIYKYVEVLQKLVGEALR
ncbi:MAG: cysteine synthase family protein [Fervidicoccaceae archaeon]